MWPYILEVRFAGHFEEPTAKSQSSLVYLKCTQFSSLHYLFIKPQLLVMSNSLSLCAYWLY